MRSTLWLIVALWVVLLGLEGVLLLVTAGRPWLSLGETVILTMLTLFALYLLQEPWKE